METPTSARDARFNLNFGLNLINAETGSEIFANSLISTSTKPNSNSNNNNNNNIPAGGLVQQLSPISRHHNTNRANLKSEICFDDNNSLSITYSQNACSVTNMTSSNDSFPPSLHHHHHHHQQQQQQQQQQSQQQHHHHHLHQQIHHTQQPQQSQPQPQHHHHHQPQPSLKKSPPSNGKKTKGRVKIKMEYIENKLRRYTTFSKRKTGIMKKAYELSTLTGTQVMLLVASETGHVYTFATRKLQPMITSDAGKALIQTCLNSPDPPTGSVSCNSSTGDQRMSATGFEETELTYNISDDDSKGEEKYTADSSENNSSDYDSPTELQQVSSPSPKNSTIDNEKKYVIITEIGNDEIVAKYADF